MKFIADAMLGRLARWLRLMGFDVLYYPDIEDSQIVRISREQERTVLTRDTLLLKRKGLKDPVFISSDHVMQQLGELRGRLDFHDAEPLGRCGVCNGVLSKVMGKNDIRDFVPEFIYHSFDEFIQCRDCKKVYWKGSHYERIREKIKLTVKAEDEN